MKIQSAISCAFVCLLLALSVSCASMNAGKASNVRTYSSDIDTVLERVVEVLAAVNLNVEEQAWEEEAQRYEISAYEINRVFNSAEGTIRSAAVLVTVERVGGFETRVTMESTRRQAPSMASSAGQTVNHEREFFSRLDDILPIVQTEEQG